ncbi:MAG TPA: hypothetical protein VG347_16770 [Verrucomicrobiae bacterium]|nr:hypothetical protein [Verrucomicrobiae bacterium]
MGSAINNLQMAVVEGKQPIIQLLRQTKLIAAKLGLADIEKWVDLELIGYPIGDNGPEVPDYRIVTAESLMVHNPVRGWQYVGDVHRHVEVFQPISDVEILSRQEQCSYTPPKNYQLSNSIGTSQATHWPQRLIISPNEFQGILEAVRNELLQWAINLEKRGIKGENMSFDEKEKQTASHMTFNIGTVHGAVGNLSNSPITFYDNKTINQLFVEKNIPKQDRRELEDILDELKTAEPAKKKSLVARAEELLVKHKEALGAAAEIIIKSIKTAME